MTIHINVPDHVENPSAYIEAAQARIRANARKTWLRTTERAQEIDDFLLGQQSGFLGDMAARLKDNGKLTLGQSAAVLKIIDERAAERAKRDQPIEGALYVGEVGKRFIIDLSIERVSSFDGSFGMTYLHIMSANNGARVTYHGTLRLGAEGDSVTVKATVKEHGQYKGKAQTVITRPVVQP